MTNPNENIILREKEKMIDILSKEIQNNVKDLDEFILIVISF
jgi:hypothetical protein